MTAAQRVPAVESQLLRLLNADDWGAEQLAASIQLLGAPGCNLSRIRPKLAKYAWVRLRTALDQAQITEEDPWSTWTPSVRQMARRGVS